MFLEELLIAPEAVLEQLCLRRGRGAGDGALESRDVFEELLFLGDEVGDALAFARVEGFVDGVGGCGGG